MKQYLVMAVIVAAAMVSGCAFLQDSPDTARITTQYATAKVIDGDSARAERIVEIVTEARATVGKDAVSTVSALDAYVRSEIEWNSLAPEDSILIDAVLARAAERLQEEVGAGVLSADERILLDNFLSWIEETAARYTNLE